MKKCLKKGRPKSTTYYFFCQKYLKAFLKKIVNAVEEYDEEGYKFLIFNELIKKERDAGRVVYKLAPSLFNHLFKDRQVQIRFFMKNYLVSLEKTLKPDEFLNHIKFLFNLCTLSVGTVRSNHY